MRTLTSSTCATTTPHDKGEQEVFAYKGFLDKATDKTTSITEEI